MTKRKILRFIALYMAVITIMVTLPLSTLSVVALSDEQSDEGKTSGSCTISYQWLDELNTTSNDLVGTSIVTPNYSHMWDHIADLSDGRTDGLRYWGWLKYTGELGTFGYQIGDNEAVFDSDFTAVPEQQIVDLAADSGRSAARMEIFIDLIGYSQTQTIRILHKSENGEVFVINEFTALLPDTPITKVESTSAFQSNVSVNSVGTVINNTDLADYFEMALNLGNYTVKDLDGQLVYCLDGISEVYTAAGTSVFTVDFHANSKDNYYMFLRGVREVTSPDSEVYRIKNFYETDGSPSDMGGAGIYARIADGTLKIMLKMYDETANSKVKNIYYELPVQGSRLTMADDGETVYILVNNKLYATITLDGAIDYPTTAIDSVRPYTPFAQKATVKLIDGTVETFENTLIDDSGSSIIGLVVRGGEFLFTSVEVEAYQEGRIPVDFTDDDVDDTCVHAFGNWLSIRPASCTEKGQEYRDCLNDCGYREIRDLPITGHTKSDWIIDQNPAPGVEGSKHIECTVCGKTLEQAVIGALPAEPDSPYIPTPNDPTVSAESKTTTSGQTVEIKVTVKNNPGIAYLRLTLKYNENVLTLVDAENGNIIKDFDSGVNLMWSADRNAYNDGTLVTLTFAVSESATEGDYSVDLVLRECYDAESNDVTLYDVDGVITVSDMVYGDVNGDMKVDGKDVLLLRKYMSNFNDDTQTSTVEISTGADANGDGVVNGRDLLLLRKYMANYNDDLGSSSVVLGPAT